MTQREIIYIIITAILCMMLGGFVSTKYFCAKCDEPNTFVRVDTVLQIRPDTVTLVQKQPIYKYVHTIKKDTVTLVSVETKIDTVFNVDTVQTSELAGYRYIYHSEYEAGEVEDTISIVNNTIVEKKQTLAIYYNVDLTKKYVPQHRLLAGAFYHIYEKNASFGLSFLHKKGYVASIYKPVANNTIMVGLSAPIYSWPK